jgi:riboflavin synthase alpha subunit
MVPVRPELGAIAIGLIGIAGVSLVVSGIVKWPFSLVLLTVLYAVIVLASRRLNA